MYTIWTQGARNNKKKTAGDGRKKSVHICLFVSTKMEMLA